jgi:dTDP-4-amino-4,6-dideoxygalactose transaminase
MPVPVPFLDLYAANRPVEAAFFRELKSLYRRSAFIGGPAVEAFEKAFAAASGAPFCVAVSSGTAALHLSMLAAGVGPGDEVIVPAFTFPGAAGPILHLGARPVFADVRREDGCLDPAAVARVLTPRTRVVLATHLFGHPADLAELKKVLKTFTQKAGSGPARRIHLIEDAAQAHGAKAASGPGRRGPVGSTADFGCFSFYPTKNLGGIGDGGAIVVRSAAVAARLRRLRDHGQAARFHPLEAGFNARMDAVQALFLTLKLPRLARNNTRRATLAARFLKTLGARPNDALRPLVPSPSGTSAWHAFVVRIEKGKRAAFLRHLDARGIGHQIYYPAALPDLPAYQKFTKASKTACPVATELARSVVAISFHPGLGAEAQVRIHAALAEF